MRDNSTWNLEGEKLKEIRAVPSDSAAGEEPEMLLTTGRGRSAWME